MYCSKTRLPIQHEIRFPGSGLGPPGPPVLLLPGKQSSSVPDRLNRLESAAQPSPRSPLLLPFSNVSTRSGLNSVLWQSSIG